MKKLVVLMCTIIMSGVYNNAIAQTYSATIGQQQAVNNATRIESLGNIVKALANKHSQLINDISTTVVNMEISCTNASRTNNNATYIISGDASAVARVGIGSSTAGTVWGLRCIAGYQKTGCYIANHGGGTYDVIGETANCLTDDEEFSTLSTISIICCKLSK